jgi:multicomponent Na+:H+ antiporter subunit D
LIIAVVDMAAFGELYVTAQASPALLAPQGMWLGFAAATSLVAALLMLTQRSLKRLLVLSTVEDVGFLMLGVSAMTTLGATGALFAAATHAVAKLDSDPVGLSNRYPVATFGFLFGMLAMLGIPPTVGFLGRWRLYETALSYGPVILAVFIISSILALIAYVLALTNNWWGPARASSPPPSEVATEPFVLQTVIVVLVGLLLAAGLWPSLLDMLQWGRP